MTSRSATRHRSRLLLAALLITGMAWGLPKLAPAEPRQGELNGGFTVLELATRDDAVDWARKIAVACRCAQELREFMYDPES